MYSWFKNKGETFPPKKVPTLQFFLEMRELDGGVLSSFLGKRAHWFRLLQELREEA